MVVHTARGFFIDLAHPFGVSSAASNLAMAWQATLDFIAREFPWIAFVCNWVDDTVFVEAPCGGSREKGFEYRGSLAQLKPFWRRHGWRDEEKKESEMSESWVYHGIEWDARERMVSLPAKKSAKYTARIDEWLRKATSSGSGSGVGIQETEKLAGTLVHCTFVFHQGRPYTRGIFAFIRQISRTRSRFTLHHPAPSVITEIRRWRDLLSSSFRRPIARRRKVDLDIWVDASTDWGVGLLVGGRWRAWQLRPGWKRSRSHDIGWLESVALEFAIYHAHSCGLSDVLIVVRSDNTGAIGQFRLGRGNNTETNECIKRVLPSLTERNTNLDMIYVESAENLADPVSRGDNKILLDATRLDRSFVIPEELSSYFNEF